MIMVFFVPKRMEQLKKNIAFAQFGDNHSQ